MVDIPDTGKMVFKELDVKNKKDNIVGLLRVQLTLKKKYLNDDESDE